MPSASQLFTAIVGYLADHGVVAFYWFSCQRLHLRRFVFFMILLLTLIRRRLARRRFACQASFHRLLIGKNAMSRHFRTAVLELSIRRQNSTAKISTLREIQLSDAVVDQIHRLSRRLRLLSAISSPVHWCGQSADDGCWWNRRNGQNRQIARRKFFLYGRGMARPQTQRRGDGFRNHQSRHGLGCGKLWRRFRYSFTAVKAVGYEMQRSVCSDVLRKTWQSGLGLLHPHLCTGPRPLTTSSIHRAEDRMDTLGKVRVAGLKSLLRRHRGMNEPAPNAQGLMPRQPRPAARKRAD